MAKATEDTVLLNKIQTVLGIAGAIALFWTLCLTRQSNRAAIRAVEVAIEAERPRVHLGDLRFQRLLLDIRNQNAIPAVEATFTNYGKAVAIIKEIKAKFLVTGTLPDEPNYSDGFVCVGQGQTIGSEKSYIAQPILFHDFNKFMPEEGSAAAQIGWPFRAHLWVYGYIVYLDHLGREHRHGFVGLYMPPDTGGPAGGNDGTGFLMGGPAKYRYDT